MAKRNKWLDYEQANFEPQTNWNDTKTETETETEAKAET